jgi:hypothetical protein
MTANVALKQHLKVLVFFTKVAANASFSPLQKILRMKWGKNETHWSFTSPCSVCQQTFLFSLFLQFIA